MLPYFSTDRSRRDERVASIDETRIKSYFLLPIFISPSLQNMNFNYRFFPKQQVSSFDFLIRITTEFSKIRVLFQLLLCGRIKLVRRKTDIARHEQHNEEGIRTTVLQFTGRNAKVRFEVSDKKHTRIHSFQLFSYISIKNMN